MSDVSLSIVGALASTVTLSVTAPAFIETLSTAVELIVTSTPVLVEVAKPADVTSYRPIGSSVKW